MSEVNYIKLDPASDLDFGDEPFSVGGWTHYEIEHKEPSVWFMNGVRATYTRIAWIDRIIHKLVYWWKFTRNEKNMIG